MKITISNPNQSYYNNDLFGIYYNQRFDNVTLINDEYIILKININFSTMVKLRKYNALNLNIYPESYIFLYPIATKFDINYLHFLIENRIVHQFICKIYGNLNGVLGILNLIHFLSNGPNRLFTKRNIITPVNLNYFKYNSYNEVINRMVNNL